MAGEVVEDCECCAGDSPPSTWRYRTGVMNQWGFPPLYEAAIAGRYIAPGWTGVLPTVRAETDTYSVLKGWSLPTGRFHFYNDVIRRRSGADGSVVDYYRRKDYVPDVFEPNPPNGFGMTTLGPTEGDFLATAAGPFVNTLIVTGFWRGGVNTFTAGQIVLRCIPDAQETTDDWHVTPYICMVAVTGAADPASDATHFQPFYGNGFVNGAPALSPGLYAFGHHGQEQMARIYVCNAAAMGSVWSQKDASTPVPAVILKGQIVSVAGSYQIALRNIVTAVDTTATATLLAPFTPLRALCPGEFQSFDNALCRPTGLRRWRSMSQRTSFVSSATDTSDQGAITIDTAGLVAGVYGALDDVFTTPSVPAIGSVVIDYVINVTSLAPGAHGVQCTGGDFTGLENGSGGSPHGFSAGDQIRVTINRNDETPARVEVITLTCWMTKVAEAFAGITFRAAPLQSSPSFLGFTEGTPDFTWVKRRARLAYPAVPSVDTAPADFDVLRTSVHAFRPGVPTLAALSNVFTWPSLIIESRRLRASVGGVALGDSAWLENGLLTQTIALSDENTEDLALSNFQIQTTQTPGPSIASTINLLNGEFYRGLRGNIVWSDRIFLHGPQTASLRTTNRCSGARTCQNVNVPAGGLNYGDLRPVLGGIVTEIRENNPCV